jgi:hypothetical protein
MKVGDIVRLPAHGGGFRVWQVYAVLYGATHQESVVRLVTLDRHHHDHGLTLVPIELLEAALAANKEGV